MNYNSSLHLGGSNTLRSNATFDTMREHLHVYASHTQRSAHQTAWLEMAVFSAFPKTPSLFARELQEGKIYFQKKEKDNRNNNNNNNEEDQYEVVYASEQEDKDDLLQTKKKTYYYDNTIKNENLLAVFKIEIELFNDECPVTCANFYQLCEPQNVEVHNRTFNNNNNNNTQNVFYQDTTYNLSLNTAKRDFTIRGENEQNTTHNNATKIFEHKDVMPSYKGTFFHKIIPKLIAQGGDVTLHVTTYGSNFLHTEGGRPNYLNNQKNVQKMKDESKKKRFDEVGLLGMANTGPDSNASQFFILTDTNLSGNQKKDNHTGNHSKGGEEASRSAFNFYNTNRNDVHSVNNKESTSLSNEKNLNGKFTCFGKVVKNLDLFLKYVSAYGNVEGFPSRFVIITDCGVGPMAAEGEEEQQQQQQFEEEDNNNNNNNAAEDYSKVKVVEECVNNTINEEEENNNNDNNNNTEGKTKSSIKQKREDGQPPKKEKHVSYKQ